MADLMTRSSECVSAPLELGIVVSPAKLFKFVFLIKSTTLSTINVSAGLAWFGLLTRIPVVIPLVQLESVGMAMDVFK